ncbi:hypothetical protein CLU79DRAFT_759978 [Phycomyces nitens]|nr:hypothetical protein CLU79DRAFT_759978 [Phycomyces nitens]
MVTYLKLCKYSPHICNTLHLPSLRRPHASHGQVHSHDTNVVQKLLLKKDAWRVYKVSYRVLNSHLVWITRVF